VCVCVCWFALTRARSSTYVWILGFYGLFHAGGLALCEVLQFGDRELYLEWWNARDVRWCCGVCFGVSRAQLAEYWRLWNQPCVFARVLRCVAPTLLPVVFIASVSVLARSAVCRALTHTCARVPVLRHVYKPLRVAGYSRRVGVFVTFFLSAGARRGDCVRVCGRVFSRAFVRLC
jgi:hypothetical protein